MSSGAQSAFVYKILLICSDGSVFWFLGNLKPQQIIEIWRSGHPQGVRKFHLHLLDLDGTASMNVQQTPLSVGKMVSLEMSLQSIQFPKNPGHLLTHRKPENCDTLQRTQITLKLRDFPCGKVEENQPSSPPKKASGMICISRSSPGIPHAGAGLKAPPKSKSEKDQPSGRWKRISQ